MLPPFPIREPWWFQPPLKPGEWSAFRAWQAKCIKRFFTAPEAVAQRQRDEAERAAGRISAPGSDVYVNAVPVNYDVAPADSVELAAAA